MFFENSPVFRMAPDAASEGMKSVAWFPNATPLRSGWAWGQNYLENTISVAETPVGEGKLFLSRGGSRVPRPAAWNLQTAFQLYLLWTLQTGEPAEVR